MDPKQYLYRIRFLDKEINSKLEQIVTLRSLAEKITATIRSAPAKLSGTEDRLARIVAKIVDLERTLDHDTAHYIERKVEATQEIDEIEDSRYRLVLEHRYLNNKTWAEIAEELGCSEQWVHTLHGRALQAFRKKRKKSEVS